LVYEKVWLVNLRKEVSWLRENYQASQQAMGWCAFSRINPAKNGRSTLWGQVTNSRTLAVPRILRVQRPQKIDEHCRVSIAPDTIFLRTRGL
jgi:hypothetical protein